MKLRRLPAGLAGLLAAGLAAGAPASPGFAETVRDLQRQIDNLTRQEQQLNRQVQNNKAQIENLQEEKEKEQQEILRLMDEIDKTGRQLAELNEQIAQINEALEQRRRELADAERRVAERDELLKTRLRAMYMDGVGTYLDVLMSASSFSDFVDRLHYVSLIVRQDRDLLEESRKNRDLVEQKRREVEQELARAREAERQLAQVKAELDRKEKEKEVRIQSLDRDIRRLDDVTEEQLEYLRQLAAKKAELIRRKRQLENQQVDFYKGGLLAWPLPGYSPRNITSPFGVRSDPFTGASASHKGIDIGVPGGSNIVAAEKGVVVVAEWVNGYGNTVVIDHGNGLRTLYGHARKLFVKEGQVVERGQKIAEVGSTGRSTGNHLHFEVHRNGVPVDPMPYLVK